MNEMEPFIQSDIFIENRQKIRITGVKDVDNFDDNSISVKTTNGDIIIGGESLKIEKLDTGSGELFIIGTPESLYYKQSDPEEKESSFFGRLFK